MGITAVSGPTISYGTIVTSCGVIPIAELNPDRGPSVRDLGAAIMDPRPPFGYEPGLDRTRSVYGWAGAFGGPVVDQVPSAVSSIGISSAQNVLSFSTTSPGAVAPTFQAVLQTSATSSNVTTITAFMPSTYSNDFSGITVLGLDCRPGTPFGGIPFGSAGTINIWDPTHALSRCLTIFVTSGGGSSGFGSSVGTYLGSSNWTWTINGFDLYGYQTTQVIPFGGLVTGVAQTLPKALKYVYNISATFQSSITFPNGSSSVVLTGIQVGVTDNFGFPLRVDSPAYTTAWWGVSSAATLVTAASSASYVFASTATATSTTGDVRGTINPSTYSPGVSNSSNRLVMFVSPSVQNLAAMSVQSKVGNFDGLVGVQQF